MEEVCPGGHVLPSTDYDEHTINYTWGERKGPPCLSFDTNSKFYSKPFSNSWDPFLKDSN